jgi:hypothetical protein
MVDDRRQSGACEVFAAMLHSKSAKDVPQLLAKSKNSRRRISGPAARPRQTMAVWSMWFTLSSAT